MTKSKKFWTKNKARQLLLKKNQFVILLCIGIIMTLVFSTITINLASADVTEKPIFYPHKDPIAPTNYTEIQYCNECHYTDPDITMSVTVYSQTTSDITYYVTGSSEKYEGIEGWAVFDKLENNKVHEHFPGYFTLHKDGQTYTVFWVDNGTKSPPDPDHPGGSAYKNITTPNNPPTVPTIDGQTKGKPGTSYEYTFVSTDSEEDKIFYYVEWGDGTNTNWFGPFNSGQTATKSHSWSEKNTYTIKAKARDEHGTESEWGTLKVTIPRIVTFNSLFMKFLERFLHLLPILK